MIQKYDDLDKFLNGNLLFAENTENEIIDAIKEIERKIDSNLASLQNCTNITHAPTSVIYHIGKLEELGENSRYNPRKGV